MSEELETPMSNRETKRENWPNLPAVNWLIHVLAEDVGRVEWVPMTKAELEERNRLGYGNYPYKTVRHPIPEGTKMEFECSRKYSIDCDSQETRDLLIQTAVVFKEMEDTIYRLSAEKRAEHWHPVSEAPYDKHSSRVGTFLVTSPILQYIGATYGTYRPMEGGKWFIIADGKLIEHDVSHWRELPPAPQKAPDYEGVKDDVEALRAKLKR